MKTNRRLKRRVRHIRVRKRVFGTAEVPRLVVFRSSKQIYAQIVNDLNSTTLVSASSLELKPQGKCSATKRAEKQTKASTKTHGDEVKSNEKSGKLAAAEKVGELLAERCKKVKITKVVFDRAGYKFHGRVAALAEGARSKGLKL